MLYISDSRETLKELKEKEEFTGTFRDYQKKFAAMNPEICARNPRYTERLPAYTPITLITQPTFDPLTRGETINELLRFSTEDRQIFRQMQESQRDILTEVAVSDMMEELQNYSKGFRKWLDVPLVLTPWTQINNSMTNESFFELSGETLTYGSERLSSSHRYYHMDQLYENMLKRDVLNKQLHLILDKKGPKYLLIKNNLKKHNTELNAQIKKLLPPKLKGAAGKYIKRNLTEHERRKMKSNAYSAKKAKKGRLLTTDLDLFNRLGVARARSNQMKMRAMGQKTLSGASYLGYAVTTIDAAEALQSGQDRLAFRSFFTGVSALYLTGKAVAELGGIRALGGMVTAYIIGGDITIGSLILLSNPVLGWIVVGGVGLMASGVLEDLLKFGVGGVVDVSESVMSPCYQEFSRAAGALHDDLTAAWHAGSRWLLDFYGQ